MKGAFGENPKRVYSGKNKSPITRMATAAIMRQALIAAREYNDKLEKGKLDPDKMPERDIGKEMLSCVIRRELPLKLHAHRAEIYLRPYAFAANLTCAIRLIIALKAT